MGVPCLVFSFTLTGYRSHFSAPPNFFIMVGFSRFFFCLKAVCQGQSKGALFCESGGQKYQLFGNQGGLKPLKTGKYYKNQKKHKNLENSSLPPLKEETSPEELGLGVTSNRLVSSSHNHCFVSTFRNIKKNVVQCATDI